MPTQIEKEEENPYICSVKTTSQWFSISVNSVDFFHLQRLVKILFNASQVINTTN